MSQVIKDIHDETASTIWGRCTNDWGDIRSREMLEKHIADALRAVDIPFTHRELEAINALSVKLELSKHQVIRQALRLYQAITLGAWEVREIGNPKMVSIDEWVLSGRSLVDFLASSPSRKKMSHEETHTAFITGYEAGLKAQSELVHKLVNALLPTCDCEAGNRVHPTDHDEACNVSNLVSILKNSGYDVTKEPEANVP